MAWDEALLEASTGAVLRLYRWEPPAVSLGYFQEAAPIRRQLPAGIDLVRRITGGGAIWHEQEVTYALAADIGVVPERPAELYHRLHQAIQASVEGRGGRLRRQPTSVGDRRYRDEPRCFASPATDDLLAVDGGKVLGSAARRRGARVLVHGSLKLASNPWDGASAAGCGLDPEAAAAAVVEGISEAFAMHLVEDRPTPAETAAAERIFGQRYADDRWVEHRDGPRA